MNPPAPATSPAHFERDVKLGGIDVKAYEGLFINIIGLHMNQSQWQRPTEFLPDRFDPAHPLSKTPSGQKRHTFAWLPFNGGKRICFGKTFAEISLKFLLTMMT